MSLRSRGVNGSRPKTPACNWVLGAVVIVGLTPFHANPKVGNQKSYGKNLCLLSYHNGCRPCASQMWLTYSSALTDRPCNAPCDRRWHVIVSRFFLQCRGSKAVTLILPALLPTKELCRLLVLLSFLESRTPISRVVFFCFIFAICPTWK